MLPPAGPGDPTALPPLFATPTVRPGRVRGGFSLRGVEPTDPSAPVPLAQVRRRPGRDDARTRLHVQGEFLRSKFGD